MGLVFWYLTNLKQKFKKFQAIIHLKHYPLKFPVHHFQVFLSVFTDSQENMQTFFNEFEDLLENIVTTHLDIYILGDFNLHLDVSDSNTQRFNEILKCFNLKQHVNFFNARPRPLA